MKRLLTVIFTALVLHSACLAAGDKVLDAIVAAGRETVSIDCDFVQTRNSSLLASAAVSGGSMSYRSPDCLKWEYAYPVVLSLSVEGGKVKVVRDGAVEVSGTGADRMFSQIARMVLNGISGRSLTDGRAFSTVVSQEDGEYVAHMTPVGGGARQMLSALTVHFDRKSLGAVKIEIYEKGGDSTVIEFRNIRRESR